MRVWGRSPQRGLGAEPLVRLGRGAKPPEAETLLAFGRSLKAASLPIFKKLETQKNQIQFVLFLQKMKSNRPQYITDYCTLMKSNTLVHFR